MKKRMLANQEEKETSHGNMNCRLDGLFKINIEKGARNTKSQHNDRHQKHSTDKTQRTQQ